MLITEILARNARVYGDETALIERDPANNSRTEISWNEFNTEANRVANVLLSKGIQKGDKVVHLMMNCIEWLPAYFGILRTGAWVVPLNFRFSAEDIQLCNEIAEGKAIIYGEEFISRIEDIGEIRQQDVRRVLNNVLGGCLDAGVVPHPEISLHFQGFGRPLGGSGLFPVVLIGQQRFRDLTIGDDLFVDLILGRARRLTGFRKVGAGIGLGEQRYIAEHRDHIVVHEGAQEGRLADGGVPR